MNPRAMTSTRREDLAVNIEEEVVAVGFDPTATTSTRWDDLAAVVLQHEEVFGVLHIGEVMTMDLGSSGCDLNRVGWSLRC